ncbi:MAG: hypothetical protein AMXMBFR64_07260 [Myxococcales bacterium]
MSGRIIVFEGLDGGGKSTLSRGVAEALGATWMTTPPEALREVRGVVDDALRPWAPAWALFYASTVLAVGREANVLAAQGADVIIDRYWASTEAYAHARGVDGVLTPLRRHVPRVDLCICVTLDAAERARRPWARGPTALDRETLDSTFGSAVLEGYRRALRAGTAARTVALDVTGLDPEGAREKALRLTASIPPGARESA